jgi:hypothetical protein
MYRLLILFFPLFINGEEVKTQKIAEVTVEDLTNIVRMIVQETLANCMVTGEMKGRAKFNLDVEGEVIARLECEFKEAAIPEEQTED